MPSAPRVLGDGTNRAHPRRTRAIKPIGYYDLHDSCSEDDERSDTDEAAQLVVTPSPITVREKTASVSVNVDLSIFDPLDDKASAMSSPQKPKAAAAVRKPKKSFIRKRERKGIGGNGADGENEPIGQGRTASKQNIGASVRTPNLVIDQMRKVAADSRSRLEKIRQEGPKFENASSKTFHAHSALVELSCNDVATPHSMSSSPDPSYPENYAMRTEHRVFDALKSSEVRKHARAVGVSEDDMDAADDCDNPRQVLIDLIIKKTAAVESGASQSGLICEPSDISVCKDVGGCALPSSDCGTTQHPQSSPQNAQICTVAPSLLRSAPVMHSGRHQNALELSLPFGGDLLSPASVSSHSSGVSLLSAKSSPRLAEELENTEQLHIAEPSLSVAEQARAFERAAAHSAAALWGASPYQSKVEIASEQQSGSSFHSAMSQIIDNNDDGNTEDSMQNHENTDSGIHSTDASVVTKLSDTDTDGMQPCTTKTKLEATDPDVEFYNLTANTLQTARQGAFDDNKTWHDEDVSAAKLQSNGFACGETRNSLSTDIFKNKDENSIATDRTTELSDQEATALEPELEPSSELTREHADTENCTLLASTSEAGCHANGLGDKPTSSITEKDWLEAGFDWDPALHRPILVSTRNKMDPAFGTMHPGEAEIVGFLADGAVRQIEDIMPAPPFKIEISDEETNKLLDLTWDQFMNHMAEGYYISDAAAVRAVEDGVMKFATFPKKPAYLDKKFLAKSGLVATNTLVPGTKAKKMWVVHRAENSPFVDTESAAKLSASSRAAASLGPFQQHIRRYWLELAQCNGHVGCALMRVFVDVFLFEMYAEPTGALSNSKLKNPHTSTVLAPTEPIEHGGMPDVLLQPLYRPLGHLLYDFFELLCGPQPSNESLATDPMASIKWKSRVKPEFEIYGGQEPVD